MKKALIWLALFGLVSLLVVPLASAERKTELNGWVLTLPDKNKPLKDIEIPVVYMNISHPFAGLIKQGVDAAAKEYGVKAYITGPTDWATDSQVNVIENLIAKKVDAMSIAVLDIPGMTPVIQKALKAGIPVTCFNVDAPESGRLSFTGEDLFKAGAATAETLVKHMGPKGKIMVSCVALSAVWSLKREEGVMSVLNKYPDIEIVDRVNARGDEQAQYAAMENSLMAHPDINGMISFGGTQFIFARVLENKGIGNLDSDKPIYNAGHDLFEEKLTQIKNGWATAAFGQNPYEQGYQAVKQLVEFMTKDVKPYDIDTGVIEVDKSNVDKFLKDLADGKPVG